MRSLTHRERVLAALSLEEPDRVPLDLGSSISTTVIIPAYENLKKYLGLEHETQIMVKRARTVIPHESILQRFDIDTLPLILGEYRGGASKQIDADTFIDSWGITWKKAPGGHFINVDGPFQNRDPKIEILETFDWPNPDNQGLYEGLKEKAKAIVEELSKYG